MAVKQRPLHPIRSRIGTRRATVAVLIATICAGCSHFPEPTKMQTAATVSVDATEISKYIQETIGWDKLSQTDKDAYTRLYNHELPDDVRQVWYVDIIKHLSAGTAGSSKLVLRAPGSNSVAAPKAPVVSAAEAKAYASAAGHIRQAWNKKIPVSKLTKTELQWYIAISKKKLPAVMQHKWEAFLAEPKPTKGHKTMAFGVSGINGQSK